jgi:hypothetical protein
LAGPPTKIWHVPQGPPFGSAVKNVQPAQVFAGSGAFST